MVALQHDELVHYEVKEQDDVYVHEVKAKRDYLAVIELENENVNYVKS